MKRVYTYNKKIPQLTTDQMIEVDRLMMDEYHIDLIQMMENAGRCLAILAIDRFLKKKLSKKNVIVLAGTGGNGGGALVCARRLYNWGVNINVYLSNDSEKMTPVPFHQLKTLERMGIPIYSGKDLSNSLIPKADLIIDGIIGYSIKGDPRGIAKSMIEWANKQSSPVLSLDTPSGLGLTTGKVHNPTVIADATMTLALPKEGLYVENVLKIRGALYLGDISVPSELYAEDSIKIKVPKKLFAKADILRIDISDKSKKKK